MERVEVVVREWDVVVAAVVVAVKAEARVEAEWADPSPEDLAVIAGVRPVVIRSPIRPVHHACLSNARNAARR